MFPIIPTSGITSVNGFGLVEQLVQFTSVQPNASAVGAIVDFNALFVSHDKKDVYAVRTFHSDSFWMNFDLPTLKVLKNMRRYRCLQAKRTMAASKRVSSEFFALNSCAAPYRNKPVSTD